MPTVHMYKDTVLIASVLVGIGDTILFTGWESDEVRRYTKNVTRFTFRVSNADNDSKRSPEWVPPHGNWLQALLITCDSNTSIGGATVNPDDANEFTVDLELMVTGLSEGS